MPEEAAKATIDLKEWISFIDEVRGKPNVAVDILQAAFGTIGFRDIDEHFRREEGDDGQWPKRSPQTQLMYALIASGRRKPPKGHSRGEYNPSNKLLQLTGSLRKSIIPANVKRASANSIMVFSNLEYSGKHQEGDKSKKLPRRSFMWLSSDAMNRMAQMSVDMWIQTRGT